MKASTLHHLRKLQLPVDRLAYQMRYGRSQPKSKRLRNGTPGAFGKARNRP